MKKTVNLVSMLLAILMVIGMTTVAGAEVTALSGSGTAADPWKIGTAEELMFAANMSNSTDAATNYKYAGQLNGAGAVYYEITADIDMSGYDFPGFGRTDMATGLDIKNIGGYGRGFFGVINGKGHVISNLNISGAAGIPAGFLCNTYSSVVTDLGFENVTIGAGSSAGAIIGMDCAVSKIQGCYVKNLTNNADGTSGNKKGALIGSVNVSPTSSSGATVINCYSINAGAQGIVGLNSNTANANVINCYTTGTAGINPTNPTAYYRNVSESQYADVVENKFVSGKLTADKLNAEYTSVDAGVITDNFVADEFGINGGFPVLAWENEGRIKLNGSGTQADPFLIGTADELVFAANQSNSDVLETRQKYAGYWSGGAASGVYYKITADIDMTGKDFPGFGRADIGASNLGGFSRGFQGVIYGDGHVISNLTITATAGNPAGFICKTAFTTITDLGLENVTIGAGLSTGAFIGVDYHYSKLQGCYVKNLTNNGTNEDKKGSLIGSVAHNTKYATFINCYSVNVGAQGIVGYTNSVVSAQAINCYTTGTVLANPTQMDSYYRNVSESQYADPVANKFVSGKLTADKLNAEYTSVDAGAITDNFVADEFGINGGFPVLAWQNAGKVKPGFPNDYTSVIQSYDPINGHPAFYIYSMLNNFNTSADGMEFGVKFGEKGADAEYYLPSCTEKDGVTVTMIPVAGQAYIIRVYGSGIEKGKTYTMTPYIGNEGAYTFGTTVEYTVPAE